jgi:hypothetical protein
MVLNLAFCAPCRWYNCTETLCVWLVKYKLCMWLYLVQSVHTRLSVNLFSGKTLFHIQVLKRVLISIKGTGKSPKNNNPICMINFRHFIIVCRVWKRVLKRNYLIKIRTINWWHFIYWMVSFLEWASLPTVTVTSFWDKQLNLDCYKSQKILLREKKIFNLWL